MRRLLAQRNLATSTPWVANLDSESRGITKISYLCESAFDASFTWHQRGDRAMENDVEAKHLAAEFIMQCRGQGRSIGTIANAAGWILQIIADLEAQRRSRTAVTADLADQR
jgi:hypothetical protein